MSTSNPWFQTPIPSDTQEDMVLRARHLMTLQSLTDDEPAPHFTRLEGLLLDTDDLKNFWQTQLSDLGLKIVGTTLRPSGKSSVTESFLAGDKDTFLSVEWSKRGKITLKCCTRSDVTLTWLKEIQAKLRKKRRGDRGRVYSIVQHRAGMSIRTVGFCGVPLNRNNYEPLVLDQMEATRKNFLRKSPRGRLVIISGEKGTGKTHLLRSMLMEKGLRFVFIQSRLVEQVLSPQFAPILLAFAEESQRPMVLVIEDGDLLLIKRGTDNMSLVASLLDLSDGISASLLNVRIVITTNTLFKDMDTAITRDLRLFRHIVVDQLSAERASSCLKDILSEIAPEVEAPLMGKSTLAGVYAKAYQLEEAAKEQQKD